MTEIALDLETLGTHAGCVILSIGAVAHVPGRPQDEKEEFYSAIDLPSCQAAGLKIEGDTLTWWLGQPIEVRAAAFDGTLSIQYVLVQFADWLKSVASKDGIEIYGKGPSFDCAILAAAYTAIGIERPWDYRDERCVRTTIAEATRILGEDGVAELVARSEVPHHALYDARAEMQSLIALRWAISRTLAGQP